MSLRTLILKIHMFGGVLCAPYLVIFGISSLNYNHKLEFTNEWTEAITVEQNFTAANGEDDKTLASAVRDSLGLWGWVPWWEYKRDEKNNLRFIVTRPSKAYTVHTDFDRQEAKIEVRAKGYWSVIRDLHALMATPGSALVSAWGIYTDLCAAFVIFSIISGVYLWTARKSERKLGLILVSAGSGTSLLLMVYMYFWG
jgi:hypothetical protein